MSSPDEPVNASGWPSVGRLAQPLVADLCRDARMLRLGISRTASDVTLVDGGIAAGFDLAAGDRAMIVHHGLAWRIERA